MAVSCQLAGAWPCWITDNHLLKCQTIWPTEAERTAPSRREFYHLYTLGWPLLNCTWLSGFRWVFDFSSINLAPSLNLNSCTQTGRCPLILIKLRQTDFTSTMTHFQEIHSNSIHFIGSANVLSCQQVKTEIVNKTVTLFNLQHTLSDLCIFSNSNSKMTHY